MKQTIGSVNEFYLLNREGGRILIITCIKLIIIVIINKLIIITYCAVIE